MCLVWGVVVVLGSTGGGSGGEVSAAMPREGFVEPDFDQLGGKWEETVFLKPVGGSRGFQSGWG